MIAHQVYRNITIQFVDTPNRNTLAVAIWDDGEHCVAKALSAWCTEYEEQEIILWLAYELGSRADK